MIVEINDDCTGCGACVNMCPQEILYIKEGKCKVSEDNKCDRLKGCMYVCPVNAIKIN